jgi:hypothetical protein
MKKINIMLMAPKLNPFMHFSQSPRLLVTEQAGKACRDDSVEGLRFYPNLFAERAT